MSEAFNAVGSEKRTQAEVKKKWSDIKVDVKQRLAAHRRGDRRRGAHPVGTESRCNYG